VREEVCVQHWVGAQECLSIDVSRHITSEEVLERLAQLLLERGTPACPRSDNGPELVAKAGREWLGKVGARTLYVEPGTPEGNGALESLNGTLRDALLQAKVLVSRWRRHCNQVWPHSSLCHRPPAPEAILPWQRSSESVPMHVASPGL
jgi:transposase InsO family protein